jgi:hypothetical protein
VAALWDKRGNAFSALFSMSMSIVAWIVGHYLLELDYPVIFTVSVCALSYTGTLLFVPKPLGEAQKGEPEMKLS